MLNQLLETKQATQRKTGGTLVSVVLHVVIVAVALSFSKATVSALTGPDEVVVKAPVADPAPVKTRVTPPANAIASAAAPHGVVRLSTPVDVPIDIPGIDFNAQPTDPGLFVGAAGPVGVPEGTGSAPLATDEAFVISQVDRAAAAVSGTASPLYPEMLKSAGVEGEALVQFVVDTLGRAELGSFRVLTSSHDAFGASVRVSLPRMRFLPAETGGRKVRMVVQQRFAFALNR